MNEQLDVWETLACWGIGAVFVFIIVWNLITGH
jgi:hypothetical protein